VKKKVDPLNPIMIKLMELFNYMIYIRLAIGGYQVILMSSVAEMVSFDLSSPATIFSLLLSLGMMSI